MGMARLTLRSTAPPAACGSSSTPPPPLGVRSSGARWAISPPQDGSSLDYALNGSPPHPGSLAPREGTGPGGEQYDAEHAGTTNGLAHALLASLVREH